VTSAPSDGIRYLVAAPPPRRPYVAAVDLSTDQPAGRLSSSSPALPQTALALSRAKKDPLRVSSSAREGRVWSRKNARCLRFRLQVRQVPAGSPRCNRFNFKFKRRLNLNFIDRSHGPANKIRNGAGIIHARSSRTLGRKSRTCATYALYLLILIDAYACEHSRSFRRWENKTNSRYDANGNVLVRERIRHRND